MIGASTFSINVQQLRIQSKFFHSIHTCIEINVGKEVGSKVKDELSFAEKPERAKELSCDKVALVVTVLFCPVPQRDSIFKKEE